MEHKKIKKILKEYKDKKPNVGYFTIAEIFGLTPKYILETLDYKNFNIDKDSIIIKNLDDFTIYSERKSTNTWCAYEYNVNNQLIKYINETGYIQYWKFNELGLEISYNDSGGDWSISEYDEEGQLIKFSTSDYSYDSNDLLFLI